MAAKDWLTSDEGTGEESSSTPIGEPLESERGICLESSGLVGQVFGESTKTPKAGHELLGFLRRCNDQYRDVHLYWSQPDDKGRIPSLEIRFDSLKDLPVRLPGWRVQLQNAIDEQSQGLVMVTSEIGLFERGVLDLAIATQTYGYRDALVIDAIKWLLEEMGAE